MAAASSSSLDAMKRMTRSWCFSSRGHARFIRGRFTNHDDAYTNMRRNNAEHEVEVGLRSIPRIASPTTTETSLSQSHEQANQFDCVFLFYRCCVESADVMMLGVSGDVIFEWN